MFMYLLNTLGGESSMNEKVILVLVDGLRPDSIPLCGHGFLSEIARKGLSTMNASTVMPSVTLPCHMSLFHSVDPNRHGILTNTWVPQVRPVKGICERLCEAGKKSAFFYNWEELRDLSRPGSLHLNWYMHYKHGGTDDKVINAAMQYIEEYLPDFAFIYLGDTDVYGHDYGWMSKEYLNSVNNASCCIERLYNAFSDRYTFIITADHGGHDRSHGMDTPEDMTIPVIISGNNVKAGELPADTNIKDIAPTIVKLLGVEADSDWEGKCLI
ncbi:hypothetical protein CDQ84_14665 [Clostridium thermosuccinogenes]|uniref:Metalloenzyme domain-containing protein n=2 Tax=Clostridium thermosuccinogenes TaxID=84032 RepID=A0A2K2FD76_9CLOT|nr:hypothetical protein CDO33_12215 [Pseudoclostridium thermosuccinogenes]PNT95567.1 hypothetical protein CDQ85_14530 [Pseudoclostridium thermosuccinogenes]PNT96728.1 hypothetical protein CDQ84_14665 [Pseudoclostridium thermosuccinogenes]